MTTPSNALPLDRLDHYFETGWASVEGFGEARVRHLLAAIGAFQAAHLVKGGVLEIGAHHGRLFLALDALRASHETSVVVDPFLHAGEAFHANVQRHSHDPGSVKVYAQSSGDMSPQDFPEAPFRIISIDGDHTAPFVEHDLALAQAIATERAIVIMDDYFNAHWPGVHEAFAKYILANDLVIPPSGKLVPVLHAFGKLILTPARSHAEAFRFLCAALEPHRTKWTRTTKFFGWDYRAL